MLVNISVKNMAFGLNSQVHRAIPQWIGLIESYTVITLDVEA